MEKQTFTDEEITYWDCNGDAEHLTHTDQNEAIHARLDELEEFPTIQKVFGWVRDPVPDVAHLANWIMESLEESTLQELLSCEDPWDAPQEITDAAKVFAQVVHDNFVPWTCDQVKTVEIDVRQWLSVHRPEWLERF